MKRRDFVKLLGSVPLITFAKADESKNIIKPFENFSKPLIIPPILEPKIKNGTKVYDLNVQEGKMAFLDGVKTETFGVNTNFLGPTIRVNRGDNVQINVKNSLKENTVLHWHGVKVPGICDGGPNRAIKPNNSWTTNFSIDQRSSMCWYHPHTYHQTGYQVYKGIAGLFIIDDEDSQNLDLPKEYGIDDIPLIFQDRRFDMQGQFLYKQSMHDTMMGVTGNFYLVNGVIEPYLKVDAKTVRLRLLNGSNARVYQFMFEDKREFYQIAGDSSFLPKPVKMKSLILSPAERAEILVDFSDLAGKTIMLADIVDKSYLLKIFVNKTKNESFEIPNKLVDIDEYQNIDNLPIRNFEINMSPGWLAINGKQMDMSRIDEKITLNQYEIWRIKNNRPMVHPFHIHGCSFKILSRNNNPAYANETGLKDTVLIYGNETVEIAVKFENEANEKYPYMYHCHILEHEDGGMMGQFTVSKS